MALALTANLTLLDNNDNSGNWSGTDGADSYNVSVQGNNSESWLVSKNSTETATWDNGSNHDMSAAGTHLYIWLKTDLSAYYTDVRVRVRTSTVAYKEFIIANVNTLVWDGAWKCFVMNVIDGGTTTGAYNAASINDIQIIINNSTSGNIRSVTNTWIDVMRYGTGLTATGTDFNIADIFTENNTVTNKYGIIEEKDGIYFIKGVLNIGNGATTTTFNSDNEVLVYQDEEVSGSFYKFLIQGSGCTAVINALTMRTSDKSYIVDMSDTSSDVTLDGCAFTGANLVTFASTSDVQNTVFNNCLQITPSTGIFKFNTVSNYVGTDGAILYPSNDSNISDITIINCDNGIEYDATSDSTTPSFNNITFDDEVGNFDVNNTSGGAVSIGNANGSNANSYNTGGSVVTFLANPVTLTITVQDTSGTVIQNARAYVLAGAIGDVTEGTVLISALTDVNGQVSDTRTYTANQQITGRVRKSSSSPYYKTGPVVGTIDKDNGATITIVMLSDE